MGKNRDLGLPYGKMEKVLVAFDVDGTLIDSSDGVHGLTVQLLKLFAVSPWKNVDVIVWSGGGADYARTIAQRVLPGLTERVKFHSKMEADEIRKRYDKIIAIDDIQDTAIGDINLIVRNK